MNTALIVITLASLGLSVAMCAVALRAVRSERRRSAARVAALAADIGDEHWPGAQPATRLASSNMFALDRDTQGRSPLPIALIAGVLIVGTIVALAVVLPVSGSGRSQALRDSSQSTGSAGATGSGDSGAIHPATGAPIELLALGHERSADRLTVHGLVRNPANGLDVTHLTAVVLLFNSAGAVVTTGRASVEADDLTPGAEARFTVSVPAASDVGRYRISFRTDDDHIVPHVDKRDGA